MPIIEHGSTKAEIDEQGFLLDKDLWDERIACAIAEREGVEELTPDRMEIIRFMRRYFYQYNAFPILRAVCRNINQPRNCVNEQFIDPFKAWKIAGLPNPEVIQSESADEAGRLYRLLVGD